MKIEASILALIAFVAIFMTVLTEARLGRYGVQYDESVGRPSYTQGNGRTYRSNGYTMNSRGYLANPTRSAQIKARNAGALTNSEARSMGLKNYRDEMDNQVGYVSKPAKFSPGEPLLCHGRRGRNCGYLEYKIDWRTNNDPPYSGWRADHPRGSLGGHRDEMDNDDFVGRPGFIGSTFRHAVNNQRPEVQRANRNGIIKGLQSTFQHPGDIPLTKKDAYVKTLEFSSKMHQHGYGSKGMGKWDEMEFDEEDESVGSYDQPSHTRAQRPTRESVNNYYNNWRL
jgi:hypothetical protein